MIETPIFSPEKDNWDFLLATPPNYSFYDSSSSTEEDYSIDYTEEELLSSLQPSTFDFLDEIQTIDNVNQRFPSKGTYVLKNLNFKPDSIKFEYCFNEIPSRCLMLSNIPPNATPDDLLFVFDQFGQYETYDISNISQGVAYVQFYSMEHAQIMRMSNIYICNTQAITIFSIETLNEHENPRKPINNGTIVLFHLPKSISKNNLLEIFSEFGRIRQIRDTPSKYSQKFIEFYDIRSAEKALQAYNGKPLTRQYHNRISIEYSLPGSFKKNIQKYYRTKLPTIVRKPRVST